MARDPEQMVVFAEIVAVMAELTAITTVSFLGPHEVVAVKTYVVVETGFAMGFETFALLSPAAGDQEYAVPPEAFKVVFPVLQIVTSGPAETTGAASTVTITG